MKFGFIIPSYINSEYSFTILKECVSRISSFHPDIPIVIIDDCSVIDLKEIFQLEKNILVEKSFFPGAGEMNPYYHFLKNKYFDIGIIIQDSMLLKKPVENIQSDTPIRFIWHFENHRTDWKIITEPTTSYNNLNKIITHYDLIRDFVYKSFDDIDPFRQFFDTFYSNMENWVGCLGVMSIVKLEFLEKLEDDIKWSRVMPLIKNRRHRMVMESLFPIFCFYKERIHYPINSFVYDYMYTNYESDAFVKYQLQRELLES